MQHANPQVRRPIFKPPCAGEFPLAVHSTTSFSLKLIDSISKVPRDTWNSLAGLDYPFLRHEFLLALEETGCTTRATGWEPAHVLVFDENEDPSNPVAVMPLYVKTHSFGEYVFDWSWAEAYHRHGLNYYPKFVSAIPFTPCAGPRIATAPGVKLKPLLLFLTTALIEEARQRDVSSWHLLFPERPLSDSLADLGISRRLGCQYQWFNEGFEDFDHFLGKFSSRKRKNIRKERKRFQESNITFDVLEGWDITDPLWETFFQFYELTYLVRGRPPYLSQAFFKRVGEVMPENLVLVVARKDGDPIAGALSFKGSDTLYGRYWGCTEEYEFLHFETCYYHGLDYCIRHGLQRFDSGAQGEHKIQRGFQPVATYSNHWIAHPQFSAAVDRFLEEEERHVNKFITHAGKFLPFKQEG